MARIFSFASGYLTEDINTPEFMGLLNLLKKLGIEGIELTFNSKKRLYGFKIDKNIKNKLKEFNYITIHSPFELVKESNGEQEIIKQLDVINSLYFEIRARRVIIHPDNLPSPNILRRYNFKVSTENLKKSRQITISKLKKIFKHYPGIGLCLDVAHAYSWSKYEVKNLVNNFGARINQIHFSASYKNKHHQSLAKATEDFLLSVGPVKKLKAPVVIEESIKDINLRDINHEINLIKSIFPYKC